MKWIELIELRMVGGIRKQVAAHLQELLDQVKEMNEITCAEVKQRIDSGDKIKLIFASKDWQFNAKRIPGSIKLRNEEDLRRAKFKIDDEIIVYSSNETCPGHKRAYKALRAIGYTNVKAFVGGLFEWESCGYKLNGGWVDNEAETSI